MLFNGKYYNKPGHLGMTRAELKGALEKAEKSGIDITAAPNITLDASDATSLLSGTVLNSIPVTGIEDDTIPQYLIIEINGVSEISYVPFISRDAVGYNYSCTLYAMGGYVYGTIRISYFSNEGYCSIFYTPFSS